MTFIQQSDKRLQKIREGITRLSRGITKGNCKPYLENEDFLDCVNVEDMIYYIIHFSDSELRAFAEEIKKEIEKMNTIKWETHNSNAEGGYKVALKELQSKLDELIKV